MPLWIIVAGLTLLVLVMQSINVHKGLFPVRVMSPTVMHGGLFVVAAYYHSWWIVIVNLLLWIYLYMLTEFRNIAKSLVRLEEKLDAIHEEKIASTEDFITRGGV